MATRVRFGQLPSHPTEQLCLVELKTVRWTYGRFLQSPKTTCSKVRMCHSLFQVTLAGSPSWMRKEVPFFFWIQPPRKSTTNFQCSEGRLEAPPALPSVLISRFWRKPTEITSACITPSPGKEWN